MGMNDRSLSRRNEPQPPSTLDGRVVESVVIRGDISALSPEDRARYYVQLCEQLGLNPSTQPFAMLRLNGKEIMYPTRGATDQLAAVHRLSRRIIDGPRVDDRFGVKMGFCACEVTHPNGRVETAVATLPIERDVSMLPMKLETKAKRRATLSILGLGMLDESEVDSIPASEKEPSRIAIDMARVRALEGRSEAVEAEEVPEALGRVYDDVKQFAAEDGTVALTIEQATAVADTHWTALVATGDDCLDAAAKYLRDSLGPRLITKFNAAWGERIRALAAQRREAHAAKQAPQEPQATEHAAPAGLNGATLFNAIGAAQSLEDLVAAWMAHRPVILTWTEEDALQARDDAAAQLDLIEGGKDKAGAAKRFDAAVAEAKKKAQPPRGPDDEGPRGGNRPRATKTNTEATGSKGEAGASTGATARAALPESERFAADHNAWAVHVDQWASPYAVQNGWAKHAPAFRAAGENVVRARLDYAARSFSNMRRCNIDSAKRALLDAEKAADNEATLPTIASRRAKRDADERAAAQQMPRTLADMMSPREAVG